MRKPKEGEAQLYLLKHISIYHNAKILVETQISLPRHNTISQSGDVFTET